MYNESIDVAEIMRKIRSEVIPEDIYVAKFDSETPQVLSDSINEITKIHSFLINTRNNLDLHKVTGYNIPTFDRFPWIIKKLFTFIARFLAKATRFITREQNIVNSDVSASLKAIVESEQQIIRALSYMNELSNQNKELENKYSEVSKKLIEIKKIAEDSNSDISKRLKEIEKIVGYSYSIMDDNLYLSFEDKFRGSNDEISRRLSYYIDNFILDKINCESNKQIIDIGCGRGEWLELLKQKGYEPTGIDINETMVKVCQDKGLDVVNMDAIEYLKKLDENSVILITGFQVVEHLHFNQLNELMKEISRVLDDDGIVILETPNPYNLEVGACNFYVDPTHKRPLHPSLLEFLAQVNGISKTEIVLWKSEEIDKWWNSVVESDETDIFNSSSYRTVVSSIKGSLYNSPDYALVGIKNGNL